MAVTQLSQMKIGETGKIHNLMGEGPTCQRLFEMGVIPGSQVEIVRFAPLGDPIDIKIRGYHLSIRRQEAESIKVFVDT